MEEKIYYGALQAESLAEALLAEFNHADWQAQTIRGQEEIAVQIARRPQVRSGGATALTVRLRQLSNGVMVQIGQQAWLDLAASMGVTLLSVLKNPWNLLHRLDDLAQDLESLQLRDRVWQVIEASAQLAEASHTLAETLDKVVCEYCGTPNDDQESHCLACGAPLQLNAPLTCPYCGFLVPAAEALCPNCHQLARQ